jgi:tight adherence protein B
MFLLIIIFITGSIVLFCLAVIPLVQEIIVSLEKKKEKSMAVELDRLFYDKSPKEIIRLYFILPPLLGLLGLIIFKSIIVLVGGLLLGLFIPNLTLKMRNVQRRHKFNNQILNAIMILSSSLKGGLSLLQALEVVAEEMPPPLSQEIGLVVRENKMGVTLEDALKHLNDRMQMEELTLVLNSIMVARGTGGDLTKVFSRLTTTIRDNRKLKDSIRTLTLQGKMQGTIMSVLPFLFVWWVMTFNRQHFDIMLQSELGRMLIFAAAALQIIGMVLIRKFSTIRI